MQAAQLTGNKVTHLSHITDEAFVLCVCACVRAPWHSSEGIVPACLTSHSQTKGPCVGLYINLEHWNWAFIEHTHYCLHYGHNTVTLFARNRTTSTSDVGMDVSCWYVLLYQWKPEWSLVIVMWWHGSCGAEITWTSVGDLKRDPEGLEPRYVSSRSISWLMHLFIKSREKTKRRIRPNHLKYRLVYSWAAAPRKGDEELRDLHGPTTDSWSRCSHTGPRR